MEIPCHPASLDPASLGASHISLQTNTEVKRTGRFVTFQTRTRRSATDVLDSSGEGGKGNRRLVESEGQKERIQTYPYRRKIKTLRNLISDDLHPESNGLQPNYRIIYYRRLYI